VIAVEVAAAAPERVARLILSSTPYVDAPRRERIAGSRKPVDEAEFATDGSHLTKMWQNRMGFYPKDRPDLLTRFAVDRMKVAERAEEGHKMVNQYRMEDRIGRVKAPVLVIRATADPFAYPEGPALIAQFPGCAVTEIEGGMVPLPDQKPQEYAHAILEYLAS
jgi:pimeloyl-ACP methyl ester carboxylesterase